ncbi:MAG: type II secretion system protein GspN [Candidatus Lambdaproteobacteria bacterium RIFOXYD12_FULL_49_8]|uniref:Type II secretion system protein GspN n=1 Tax=Candidatus Lambdaproteobacteria bacterium RIFOXYD2_FULL_50_16 TaxID=1817772 RepID=A0A1F6GFU7_9PROT|nr:MAG: type II secretion system protein GspN [Candidatus Lambdaproteobacteria bacterium RIFOXYD12_FULL_49_8]OGG96981.1 MAG: type II secretion system protein GspN [Candidatus Lambdaproteobacteria bacterium RIFOXYD2_FULL_50_16]
MNGLVKKTLIGLLWLWLFWAAFWVSLDGDRLARLLENQWPANLGVLKISSLETRLFGLTAQSLVLNGPGELVTGPVAISFAPWHLLLGRVGFEAELYQGKLAGVVSIWGPELIYEARGILPNRHAELRKMRLITSNPVLSAQGRHGLLSGEGQSEISLIQVSISGNPSQTGLPLEMPDTSLSRVVLTGELKGNELKLNVNTQGDFGGQLDGTIQINRQTPQLSQLNLKLSGQFAPELESRLGLVATLIQGYRDPAGHIGLSIEGPLQMPQVRKL